MLRSSAFSSALVASLLLGCNNTPRDFAPSGSGGASSGGSAGEGNEGGASSGGSAGEGGSSGSSSGGSVATGGNGNASGGSDASGGSMSGGAGASAGGTSGSSSGGNVGTGGNGDASGGSDASGGQSGVLGPETLIIFASVDAGESTSLTSATFDFASLPAGAAGFECRMDGSASFSDCTTGFSVEGLLAGGHNLEVRALDEEGNRGPITERSWLIVPLTTTIQELQSGTVPEHTLARVSTNVRLSGMVLRQSEQLIFVQEAQQTTGFSVDMASDLNTAARSGILTRPLATQTSRSNGTAVTVTGIYRRLDGNRELVAASYQWGNAGTPWNTTSVRTAAVLDERLHGVSINVGGEIPNFNCSSSCSNPSWFGHSTPCIMACMSSMCTAQNLVEWVMADGIAQPEGGWGSFEGFLVGKGTGSYLLIVESFATGDDVCM